MNKFLMIVAAVSIAACSTSTPKDATDSTAATPATDTATVLKTDTVKAVVDTALAK